MQEPREKQQSAAAADSGQVVKTPPGQGQVEPAQKTAPDGQQPNPDDPATQEHGPQLEYFVIRIGGEDGKPVGLFRVADDEAAQALTLERFTAQGEWEDDPTLIDELHEPGCFSVDENEAQTIQSQILSATQ